MRLLIPLLFLVLALPSLAEAKPLRGASECVRFYVGVAQEQPGPSPWIGQKVRWCH